MWALGTRTDRESKRTALVAATQAAELPAG
jgi:hypothetical protein